MFRPGLSIGLVLALSACGGASIDQKQVLIETCIADGDGDEAQCTCAAEQAIATLEPKLIEMMVEAAGSEDSEAYMVSKVPELTIQDGQSFQRFLLSVTTQCSLEIG